LNLFFLTSDDNERKEKLVLTVDCQLVTLMTIIKGRLVISTTHAYFHDLTPITEDCDRHDFKVGHVLVVNKLNI